ncbi:hypothetical protein GCM10029964_061500 [Kibdelosporangium lantanae]
MAIQDPAPMQPRWTVASPQLQDHWATIGMPYRDDAGRLDDVADLFVHLSSGRLAAAGEPGAGKTVLALRLTLALVERRATGDPVPVLLSHEPRSCRSMTGRAPMVVTCTDVFLDTRRVWLLANAGRLDDLCQGVSCAGVLYEHEARVSMIIV